jgi:hypothetical protein
MMTLEQKMDAFRKVADAVDLDPMMRIVIERRIAKGHARYNDADTLECPGEAYAEACDVLGYAAIGIAQGDALEDWLPVARSAKQVADVLLQMPMRGAK